MLRGSIVALVTPFNSDGSVNTEKFKSLIEWHIEKGSDGILVCGTTGESATLSHPEHKMLIEIAVKTAKARIPIVAGCGSNCTQEALDLALHAKKVGADYGLVITPYYNRPTQEGLFQHFKTIATAVKLPFIIYNVPSRTGSNILPETVARIYKDCKNIIGIKEASGDLDQITRLMSLVDKNFFLYSGSDELTVPILSLGAVGVISVAANIVPKEMHNLVINFLDGNLEQARRLQLSLYELIKALFIETNPIPVKTALWLMGMLDMHLRLPLCAMSEANLTKFKAVLKKYKLL